MIFAEEGFPLPRTDTRRRLHTQRSGTNLTPLVFMKGSHFEQVQGYGGFETSSSAACEWFLSMFKLLLGLVPPFFMTPSNRRRRGHRSGPSLRKNLEQCNEVLHGSLQAAREHGFACARRRSSQAPALVFSRTPFLNQFPRFDGAVGVGDCLPFIGVANPACGFTANSERSRSVTVPFITFLPCGMGWALN